MMEASAKVQRDFPEDSFQRVLWEEQQKYNKLKNKRQITRNVLSLILLELEDVSSVRVFGASGCVQLLVAIFR